MERRKWVHFTDPTGTQATGSDHAAVTVSSDRRWEQVQRDNVTGNVTLSLASSSWTTSGKLT